MCATDFTSSSLHTWSNSSLPDLPEELEEEELDEEELEEEELDEEELDEEELDE